MISAPALHWPLASRGPEQISYDREILTDMFVLPSPYVGPATGNMQVGVLSIDSIAVCDPYEDVQLETYDNVCRSPDGLLGSRWMAWKEQRVSREPQHGSISLARLGAGALPGL